MKVYKYLAAEHFTKVFHRKSFVSLKANHPKEFNDPYELFLTIDRAGVEPEVLAYYQEILGQVPQWPTVCFSARPDVVPMWAHYARECSGVVIEFDEGKILEAFPEGTIQAVSYSETPITIDAEQVAYAYQTSKPRHAVRLRRAAFDAAYFSKSSYWNYELEHRFVIDHKAVTNKNGLMTIQFPLDCVSAIIVGPKMKLKLAAKIGEFCNQRDVSFYRMCIARSSLCSFFVDPRRGSFIFDGEGLVEPKYCCIDCDEPLETDAEERCHWCAVSEADKTNAAFRTR